MFTGLVEALGEVRRVEPAAPACRLTVAEANIAGDISIGESIAVNGVCLTVVDRQADQFAFEVGPETLRVTNLGELKQDDRVNLERAMKLGDRIGGHLVQGHVDGLGRIIRRQKQDEWDMIWIECPPALTRHMVPKGSVAVDGVSLTLVDVQDSGFSVALIPHTLAMTTLGFKPASASVNLETDLFAKYMAKYLESAGISPRRDQG
jgi:riboflavin synthase